MVGYYMPPSIVRLIVIGKAMGFAYVDAPGLKISLH